MTTRQHVAAFVATASVFTVLDIVWIVTVMQPMFRDALGPLIRTEIVAWAGALFYVIYLIGVFAFAVKPSQRIGNAWVAAGRGALLGLIAYGTYELTNYATLKDWPLKIVLIDMSWGVCMTAVAAATGAKAARMFAKL